LYHFLHTGSEILVENHQYLVLFTHLTCIWHPAGGDRIRIS